MASGSGKAALEREILAIAQEGTDELGLSLDLAQRFARWDFARALIATRPHPGPMVLGPLVWDAMLNTGVLVDLHLWQLTDELLEAALAAAVIENPDLLEAYMVSYDEENDH